MKKCAFCGKENDAVAVSCSECCTTEFTSLDAAPIENKTVGASKYEIPPLSPEDRQKDLVAILLLDSEFEATMIIGKLRAYGISASLMAPGRWNGGGQYIEMSPKDYEAAKDIINA
jgi:hypothetical protein